MAHWVHRFVVETYVMIRQHNKIVRGFSLLELLVVLGGIMVTLAIAIIQTSSYIPTLRANSAMAQVLTQLRETRNNAISKRRIVQVQFVGNNQIQITQIEPVGVSPVTSITLGGGVQFTLSPGVPDTPMAFGNTAAVYFGGVAGGPTVMDFSTTGGFMDGNGNPIDGTVFLGIPGLPGTARAVAVLGATGRLRQYHWDGNAWQE